MIDENQIVSKLSHFGISKDEAITYLTLLKKGPSTASEVGHKMGFYRTYTYRVLKTLEEKGLVEITLERPFRFIATPLEETLNQRLDEVKHELLELEKSKSVILDSWGKVSAVDIVSEKPKFSMLQGRRRIYDFIHQMCRRAEKEILFMTTRNDLNRLFLSGVIDLLKSIERKGVRIRFLIHIDKPAINIVEKYLRFIECHHLPLHTILRLVIIDKKEIFSTAYMDDSMSMTTKKDVGLWTNAASYVTMVKDFFDSRWRTTTDAQEIIDSLKEGKAPEEMKIISGEQEYIDLQKEMVKSSKTEIYLLQQDIHNLPLTFKDFQTYSDRGITIQVVTQIDLSNVSEIKQIIKYASVRHARTTLNINLLIVDKKAILINIPIKEGKGYAIWTNTKNFLTPFMLIYDSLWENSIQAQDTLLKLVNQQTLINGLQYTKKALEAISWNVETPGKIISKVGASHIFNLVARKETQSDTFLVLDLLVDDDRYSKMIALGAKAMDVKPILTLIGSTKSLEKEERKLLELYDIKFVYFTDPKQLPQIILNEIKKHLTS